MQIASVVVPVAESPFDVRIFLSRRAAVFASVEVITAFTSAADVRFASTSRMILIVPDMKDAGAEIPADAALLMPAVTKAVTVTFCS